MAETKSPHSRRLIRGRGAGVVRLPTPVLKKGDEVQSSPTSNDLGGNDDGLLDLYDEGLGADFRKTRWKKPSKTLAMEHRSSTMYDGGKAAVWGNSDTRMFQMGEGVGLYFAYLRRMLAFSALATVLTLPHLFISFFGKSLSRAEMDPLRLLTFAAGNHRIVNSSETVTVAFHPCQEDSNETLATLFAWDGATCNDKFWRLFGNPEVFITAKGGSYLIMVCDVLCCLLFMAFYWNFSREIVKVEERITRENVTPADYAVEVRGLPENASDEDVINHFNDLYRLDKPGWTYPGWGCLQLGKKMADMPEDVTDCSGVSIGAKLKPIESTKHSRFDHICKGTWLAECSLAHPEGDFIRQAKNMTSISEKLLEARARVKKYRTSAYTSLWRQHYRQAEVKLRKIRENLKAAARELKSRAKQFEFTSWKTSAAFVIFNHEASVIRCLSDYARYPMWVQPPRLRFRGICRIKVQRAPEAGNILWENLETTPREKWRRKTLTLWVTIALLALSFMILYASKIAEREYNAADFETEHRCLEAIPALHGLPPRTPFIGSLDAADSCEVEDMWITLEGSPYQSAGQENGCLEPCINTLDGISIDCGEDINVSPAQIATCLCRQEIEERGIAALEFVRLAGGSCRAYGTAYAVGKMLTIVASAFVVAINFGLKYALKRMGDFERHPSVTEQAVSNVWKITLALFINLACVIFLVNLPESSTVFESPDTTNIALSASNATNNAEWYTTTGQALITTIAINCFAPRAPDLMEYWFLGPLRRNVQTGVGVLTQRQLNKVWDGRRFDLSSRLPITLMMMAVAMTFSPALPVVFFMITVYLFCTYHGDKFHLLRVCRTPPQYDGRIIKVGVHMMPWMLILHCMLALFAFSADTFFASDYIADIGGNDVEVDLGVENASTQSVSQSTKLICLPYFIILVIMTVYLILTSTLGRLLNLSSSVVRSCKCIRTSAKVSAPRVRITNPPYTEVFERGYPPRDPVPSFFRKEMNWLVREDARGCHFLQKSRDMNTTTPRSARRKGTTEPELLFTWEVLHSINATHTFHIEDNPAYHDIVITRNMIAQELGITTPKSPRGKLWSPAHYKKFMRMGRASPKKLGKKQGPAR